jgi:predicted GNAT family acetyltransferase
MANITHDSDNHRFILTIEPDADTQGSILIANDEAILEYRFLADQSVDFSRTFVPDEFRGKGLAEKLVRHGLAWAKQQQYSIQASCWYVDKFLR